MALLLSNSVGGDYEMPDQGVYTFELTLVNEPRTEPDIFNEGKERTTVCLEWTIRDDDDFGGTMVRQYYTLKLGNNDYPSKLRPFVKAMLGRDIEDDEEVDLDGMTGKSIQATITHKPNKAGAMRAHIEAPVPIRKKKGQKPLPVVVPSDDPFADEDEDAA